MDPCCYEVGRDTFFLKPLGPLQAPQSGTLWLEAISHESLSISPHPSQVQNSVSDNLYREAWDNGFVDVSHVSKLLNNPLLTSHTSGDGW